jgi:hypothetical protein
LSVSVFDAVVTWIETLFAYAPSVLPSTRSVATAVPASPWCTALSSVSFVSAVLDAMHCTEDAPPVVLEVTLSAPPTLLATPPVSPAMIVTNSEERTRITLETLPVPATLPVTKVSTAFAEPPVTLTPEPVPSRLLVILTAFATTVASAFALLAAKCALSAATTSAAVAAAMFPNSDVWKVLVGIATPSIVTVSVRPSEST